MKSPTKLGLPSKFIEWRPGQFNIVTDMLSREHRFSVHVVPTGGGKSLSYMAMAKISGKRTLILTSTKALQDQLQREFGDMITVVKGKRAYLCKASLLQTTCDRGPCHWKFECRYKEEGCNYYDQIRKGRRSTIVVTNYAFWISNAPEILGQIDILVMDEAHDAASNLLDVMSISIQREDVYGLCAWIPRGRGDSIYYDWIRLLKIKIQDKIRKSRDREWKLLSLYQKVSQLDGIIRSNWIVEHKGYNLDFDAIWPANLAPFCLFRGIERVILTSATVGKSDLAMLGIKNEDTSYKEYPSTFPVGNRLIYYVPTARMDRFITNAAMNTWANRIDQIIASRICDKGIVHTVSYDRAKRIHNFSTYKEIMLTHETFDAAEVVSYFKEADPPKILVSPTMVTGWDFPYDECRWQIIGKVPFSDGRPLVMKARQSVDPDYGCYSAIKQLVQACGRGVRAEDDYCECFIIDDHFKWVIGKYRELFPKWWLAGLRSVATIPPAIDLKIYQGKGGSRLSRE